jgi:hypothetical protein
LIDGIKAVRKDIFEDYDVQNIEDFIDKYSEINEKYKEEIDSNNLNKGPSNWIRFRITLLNLVVSSSVLAG